MLGDTIFFQANDGVSGLELWKSDGTPGGTSRVKDIRAGSPSSLLSVPMLAAGGRMYFVANDVVAGQELWQSDGTDT